MRGALNLLSLYTFMAGTRPTLPSTFLTPPTRGETIYGPFDSIPLRRQITETQRKDTSIENSCFNLVKWYRSYSFLNAICERQVKIRPEITKKTSESRHVEATLPAWGSHDFVKTLTSKSDVCWTVHHCDNWRIKNQTDATYYFIVLLIGSTCFGHYYVHHQELVL